MMDKKYSIIIYFLTQIIIFIAVIANLEKQQRQEIIASLISLMLITVLLYMWTSLMNPGYVPAPKITKQLIEIQNKKQKFQEILNNSGKQSSVDVQNIFNIKNSALTISQETIELKNCKYCSSLLKLRQKHCKQCDKCVSTFDHHCPFFNNCIGQFNRPIFYLFLLSQTAQIIVNLCHIMQNEIQNKRTQIGILIFSTLLILGFLSGTLLVYHTWLMAVNSTTWEVLRAQKIWYINPQVQNQEEEEIAVLNNEGNNNLNIHVFNQNVLSNTLVYWKAICRSSAIDWQPYYKPNPTNNSNA